MCIYLILHNISRNNHKPNKKILFPQQFIYFYFFHPNSTLIRYHNNKTFNTIKAKFIILAEVKQKCTKFTECASRETKNKHAHVQNRWPSLLNVSELLSRWSTVKGEQINPGAITLKGFQISTMCFSLSWQIWLRKPEASTAIRTGAVVYLARLHSLADVVVKLHTHVDVCVCSTKCSIAYK